MPDFNPINVAQAAAAGPYEINKISYREREDGSMALCIDYEHEGVLSRRWFSIDFDLAKRLCREMRDHFKDV